MPKVLALDANNNTTEISLGDSIEWSLLTDVPVYATRWPTWDEVSGKPTTFPPATHTHTIAQVTGLQAALDGKAAASHTHSIGNITNLQTTLDAKADASALNALDSRVTAAEGTITSQGSAITSLQNSAAALSSWGDNLVGNADFQLGLKGWVAGGGGSSANTIVWGPTNGENGPGVVVTKAHSSSNPFLSANNYEFIPARANRKYRAIIRCKHVSGGDKVLGRLRWRKTDGSTTAYNDVRMGAPSSWGDLVMEYTSPADTNGLRLEVFIYPEVGVVAFDSIQLFDITEEAAGAANATAISALETRVTSAEGAITSQGSAITALQNSVTGLSNTKADASHTHEIADVTGLQAALDGKSNVGHGHTISDVSGLQAALDGKSPTTHDHDSSYAPKSHVGATGSAHGTATSATAGFMSASDKSKLDGIQAGAINQTTADGRYERLTNKGAANGYASLGADGKIPASQLPAIAITDTFVVNTEAAMLALVAEQGDVAVRADLNQTFILKAEPASVLSNWELLRSPTAAVESVNGQTGAVNLTYTDVGAAPSSHDHASISGNAATASKLKTSRTISLTGDATGSASFDGSANVSITVTVQDDSHNHVISNVDGLQAALDGKANSGHTHSASDITSGTLSDARLPSTMGGKTFTGAISAPSVGVGTAGGLIYQTASNGSVGVRSGDVGNYRYFRFDANGTFYALNGGVSADGNVIAYASDGRLKENIVDASAAKVSDFFDRFRVREFDWDYEAIAKLNPAFSPNADHEIGAIAQEVEEIYPLMVACHEHSGIKTIMWEKAVPLLIAEVQALRKRVAELEGGT